MRIPAGEERKRFASKRNDVVGCECERSNGRRKRESSEALAREQSEMLGVAARCDKSELQQGNRFRAVDELQLDALDAGSRAR